MEKALVSNLPENHDTAATITCPILRKYVNQERTPVKFVGLTNHGHLTSLNMPEVTLAIDGSDDEIQEEQKVRFTVCVPAMYAFENAAQLVEKIEMSRLMGAGRVVFYNHSIPSIVDTVLRMYAREWSEGRETLEVKVYPWHFSSFEQYEKNEAIQIHYLGQMATIDHCLHRYRHLSQYIIFTDMDEFIVPLQHNCLFELVSEHQNLNTKRMGFLFQSTVFNKKIINPASGFEANETRYVSAVLGHTSPRSKVNVDSSKVDVMGIHFIWHGSGVTDEIRLDQGFVAHYREPLCDCQRQTVDPKVCRTIRENLGCSTR
ncbi:hypothetical protein RRG08_034107 [Elysia crispata]|uniref:Glycosyltransferase family 92 protein n=1 Tax=Elysia crispata TaxID=231223 RepID=A0AAE0Z178_9GAST|nr:hypothetical protein RRG08_034107 [Elysia crispata]